MATNAIYTVPYRRQRVGKTNYHKRLTLLRSKELRVIIRKSSKHVQMQLVQYQLDGDKVLVTTHSQVLKKLGWKHNTGNLPAYYLTGLIFGLKCLELNYTKGILDLGLYRVCKGNKVYAALKGIIDAGFEIPHSDDIFPQSDRIEGKHIGDEVSKDFDKIKKSIMVRT